MLLFKKKKNQPGFSLIEVILTLTIIGVLVGAGISFITPFIKIFFYAPEQLRTEYITNQIVNTIIEGNHESEGLNSAKIINYASNEVVVYTNNNDEIIILEWDSINKKIIRSLPSGKIETLPPDMPNHQLKVEGSENPAVVFQFLNSFNELVPTPINDPWLLSSVQLHWVAYTGADNQHHTNYQILTGVHIKKSSD